VGGLPGRQFARLPSFVRSKDGFHGCLASIDCDGRVWSPDLDVQQGGYLSDIADDVRQFVKSGCPGIIVVLSLSTASNVSKLISKLEHQRRLITTRAPLYSHFRTCPPFLP